MECLIKLTQPLYIVLHESMRTPVQVAFDISFHILHIYEKPGRISIVHRLASVIMMAGPENKEESTERENE